MNNEKDTKRIEDEIKIKKIYCHIVSIQNNEEAYSEIKRLREMIKEKVKHHYFVEQIHMFVGADTMTPDLSERIENAPNMFVYEAFRRKHIIMQTQHLCDWMRYLTKINPKMPDVMRYMVEETPANLGVVNKHLAASKKE